MQDLLYKQHCKNSPEHCRSTCSTHCTGDEVFGNVTTTDPREGGEMGQCFPSLLPAPCISLKDIMLGWRRRMVCCSLRSSQPPKTCRISCLFLLEKKMQVMLGIQHRAGMQGKRQSGTQPHGWTQKELQKEPQAVGNPGLRFQAHQPCAYRRNTLGFSITGPHSNPSSCRRSQGKIPSQDTSQAGAIQTVPAFSELFPRPVLPTLSPFTCTLPSSPSFRASQQLLEG